MATPGRGIVLPSGKGAVLSSGKGAIFNGDGRCGVCCVEVGETDCSLCAGEGTTPAYYHVDFSGVTLCTSGGGCPQDGASTVLAALLANVWNLVQDGECVWRLAPVPNHVQTISGVWGLAVALVLDADVTQGDFVLVVARLLEWVDGTHWTGRGRLFAGKEWDVDYSDCLSVGGTADPTDDIDDVGDCDCDGAQTGTVAYGGEAGFEPGEA